MSDESESVHKCPWDGCSATQDSRGNLKLHHYNAHGERLIDYTECETCGEQFEPYPSSKARFCSHECSWEANRTTTDASEDGGEAQVDMDSRLEAAAEDITNTLSDHGVEAAEVALFGAESRQTVTWEADDVELSRPECDGFETGECGERCVHCGSKLVTQDRPDSYCSVACKDESSTKLPRPTIPDQPGEERDRKLDILVWLLYVYEDNNLDETYHRQRSILGYDNRLEKNEVRSRLIDLGVFTNVHQRLVRTMSKQTDVPDGDDSWKKFYQRGEAGDD